MCLVTTMKMPFTAKKDFVVCKVLTKTDDWGFITPCQEVAVDLNDTLKPNTKFPESLNIRKDSCSEIKGGAIHVYIKPLFEINRSMCYGDRLFKAIIRKGTRFYVNTNGTEIAAEELYITDEEPTDKEIAETQEYIAQELIDAAEQHNGIRVGDILLSDKSFVHVEDYKDDGSMTAIGVVGYFINEKPISIGLKAKRIEWALDKEGQTITNEVSKTKVYSDYNGREYTDKLYKVYKDRLDNFPALKYCVEYETEGTKKGDWYFPSSGEVANIGRNLALINYSLRKINRAELMKEDEWYRCSAEISANIAWTSYIYDACLFSYPSKSYGLYVRPVLGI